VSSGPGWSRRGGRRSQRLRCVRDADLQVLENRWWGGGCGAGRQRRVLVGPGRPDPILNTPSSTAVILPPSPANIQPEVLDKGGGRWCEFDSGQRTVDDRQLWWDVSEVDVVEHWHRQITQGVYERIVLSEMTRRTGWLSG
jgi:hypothetical protein